MNFKILFNVVPALFLAGCAGNGGGSKDLAPYQNETLSLEERVEDALSRMTLEEKVAVLHAQSKFSSAGVPRLGIPEFAALTRALGDF